MTVARSSALILRTTAIIRSCMAPRVWRTSVSDFWLDAMRTLRRSSGFGVRVMCPVFSRRSRSAVVDADVMPR